MTHRTERVLALACVADQSAAAASLHEALVSLFPTATIAMVDTNVEQGVPETIDCAVVDTTVNGTDGIEVLRRLRARGYGGPAVLIVDGLRSMASSDEASAARLGVRLCSLQGELVTPLAVAVHDALRIDDASGDGAAAVAALRALRQTQRLMAAGELAMRLQHSLNNPLAALLAEAQLLELETLAPDHRDSVERIIELCRRVIEVVRGMEGVGRA
jgi:signal transduction histidine kinase